MKKVLAIMAIAGFMAACNNSSDSKKDAGTDTSAKMSTPDTSKKMMPDTGSKMSTPDTSKPKM